MFIESTGFVKSHQVSHLSGQVDRLSKSLLRRKQTWEFFTVENQNVSALDL